MIKLTNLSFSYCQKKILKEISFMVRPQEIVALIGTSGSGKTTLFRLMTGLEAAQAGTIEGIDSTSVSYMQQEDLLLPWRSVMSNLLLVQELGRERATHSFRKEARRLLKVVDLEGVEELLPNQLSGGMRQRVSLVRALLQDRPILLLDEPFGPLDVIVREELYSLLRSIRTQLKKTIIMVTHDFRDALALADRILVLSGGKIALDTKVEPNQEAFLIQEIRSSLCPLGNRSQKR